jgi:hypothetical protein
MTSVWIFNDCRDERKGLLALSTDTRRAVKGQSGSARPQYQNGAKQVRGSGDDDKAMPIEEGFAPIP